MKRRCCVSFEGSAVCDGCIGLNDGRDRVMAVAVVACGGGEIEKSGAEIVGMEVDEL